MTTHSAAILLVDDEPDILDLLGLAIIQMGLNPVKAHSLNEAKKHILSPTTFSLCITDLRLPDGEGTELLSFIQEHQLNLPLAVITAHGSQSSAVEAMKQGAFDYLNKPIGLEQLRSLIKSALPDLFGPKKSSLSSKPDSSQKENDFLLGNSARMLQVKDYIRRFAASNAPVYIFGESGSGKERAARLIHALSRRANGPFIAVNCGAIPEALMESEFFGHRKGAFTGADRDHIGFFQAAEGGTLFLDEIAELPLLMQVKLLRAIQEKSVRRLGSTEEVPVNIRLLCATHQPLQDRVNAGLFRHDLYYRINVIQLDLPPLRELSDDISLIASHSLKQLAHDQSVCFTPAALEALQHYSFPGNVRELENIIERALALRHSHDVIDIQDLKLVSTPKENHFSLAENSTAHSPKDVLALIQQEGTLESYLDNIERKVLETALEATHGNRTNAAHRLGITLRSLRYRLDRLNLNHSTEAE
jgi:two-component system, NtrC family, response regulator PilR